MGKKGFRELIVWQKAKDVKDHLLNCGRNFRLPLKRGAWTRHFMKLLRLTARHWAK